MNKYVKNASMDFDGSVCVLKRHEPVVSILCRWGVFLGLGVLLLAFSVMAFLYLSSPVLVWASGFLSFLLLMTFFAAYLRSGWRLTDHYTYCFIDKESKLINFSYDGQKIKRQQNFINVESIFVRVSLLRYVKYFRVFAKCDGENIALYTFVLSKGYDLKEGQKAEVIAWLKPLADWWGVNVDFEGDY